MPLYCAPRLWEWKYPHPLVCIFLSLIPASPPSCLWWRGGFRRGYHANVVGHWTRCRPLWSSIEKLLSGRARPNRCLSERSVNDELSDTCASADISSDGLGLTIVMPSARVIAEGRVSLSVAILKWGGEWVWTCSVIYIIRTKGLYIIISPTAACQSFMFVAFRNQPTAQRTLALRWEPTKKHRFAQLRMLQIEHRSACLSWSRQWVCPSVQSCPDYFFSYNVASVQSSRGVDQNPLKVSW